jgi:hypothetical protein
LSRSQEFSGILWKPNVNFHSYQGPSNCSYLLLDQSSLGRHFQFMNIISTLSYHLRLDFSSGVLPSAFPNKYLHTKFRCVLHALPISFFVFVHPNIIYRHEYIYTVHPSIHTYIHKYIHTYLYRCIYIHIYTYILFIYTWIHTVTGIGCLIPLLAVKIIRLLEKSDLFKISNLVYDERENIRSQNSSLDGKKKKKNLWRV